MLLRRITRHFKEQNWFAVYLDLFIVILGVFIGIQVANWNEVRKKNAQELIFLGELRTEIEENTTMMDLRQAFSEKVIISGQRALNYLNGDASCVTECESLLIAFFHASQFWGTSYNQTVYREAQRLGFPTDKSVKTSIQLFYKFIEGLDNSGGQLPAYRESLRSYLTPEMSKVLWQGCYSLVDGQREELPLDCLDELKVLDLDSVLLAIKNDPQILLQLQFWLGQSIMGRKVYPLMKHQSDVAINSISATLKH